MKLIKGGNSDKSSGTEISFPKFMAHFCPSPQDVSDFYHLCIIAWNLGVSIKVTGMNKKELLQQTKESMPITNKEWGTIVKMVDYKLATYPDEVLLVKSITFDKKDKSLTKFTMDLVSMRDAANIAEMDDFDDDDFDDFDDDDDFDEDYDGGDGFYEGFIDRSGIAVRPKPNLINLSAIQSSMITWTMYMFEDVDDEDEEIEDIAKKYMEDIIHTTANLLEIDEIPDGKLNYSYFKKYFDYFFIKDIYDLLDSPIEKF